MYNAARCIGCGSCAAVCQNGQHRLADGRHTFLRDHCADCGACAGECVSGALTLAGRRMSVDEVMAEVRRDLRFYRESGGGMTLSGGEPLAQAAFAQALLAQAKAEGIHTCVETSGYAPTEALDAVAAFTDRFLFDYKATGDEMHRALCGVPQTPILDRLARIDARRIETVLRCPIIPGLNDTDAHIAGIADTARRYACIVGVQLMGYHRLGIAKASQLGVQAGYEGQPPDKARLKALCDTIAARAGKPTDIG